MNLDRRNQRGFFVGAATGSGMTAQAAERAGADFLLALSAGRFRNMGGSSPAALLPIRDSNAMVAAYARTEILPGTRLPILFGACIFDPRLEPERFLDDVERWGFHGVTNFPSVIHLDQVRRAALERAGYGYAREIALLTAAQGRGLHVLGYTHTPAEARQMVAAGVRAVCMNFNLNAGEPASAAIGLSEMAARVRDVARAVHSIDRKVVCLLGGGPITKPDELFQVCRESGAHGFVGGSSLDRIPLQTSVLEITAGFKTVNTLREKVDRLERQLRLSGYRHGIVAQSAKMNQILDAASHLAAGANPVVVTGEAGTGKRALASLVHALGPRKGRPAAVVTIRNETAAEQAEILFGREASGAAKRKLATLEGAMGSAVIVLHIDRLAGPVQERLADFIETGLFIPEGAVVPNRSDAKIVTTATCEDAVLALRRLLVPKLADRLLGFQLEVPPLRDRLEDLPLLIQHFLVELRGEDSARSVIFENSAFRALATYDWPGNVRQLRQVVERLSVSATGRRVTAEHLAPLLDVSPASLPTTSLSERDWIIDGLRRNKLHRGRTARFLGISRKTLYTKIKTLKILD